MNLESRVVVTQTDLVELFGNTCRLANVNGYDLSKASIDKPSLGEDEVSLRLVGSNASGVAR